MRDYDEIISTLTEDEKIQLVLAKTSFPNSFVIGSMIIYIVEMIIF